MVLKHLKAMQEAQLSDKKAEPPTPSPLLERGDWNIVVARQSAGNCMGSFMTTSSSETTREISKIDLKKAEKTPNQAHAGKAEHANPGILAGVLGSQLKAGSQGEAKLLLGNLPLASSNGVGSSASFEKNLLSSFSFAPGKQVCLPGEGITKDWLVGFSEGDGCFISDKSNKLVTATIKRIN
jgi:hypothetical protein